MAGYRGNLPHIVVPGGFAEALPYTYAKPFGGSAGRLASQVAATHGGKLRGDLQAVGVAVAKINAGSGGDGLAGDDWMVLEFESEPTFPLELERLDRKGGIELLSVRERGSATLATVLVPEGRLQVFEKLVQEYLTKQTDTGKPKNEAFLANIAAIRLAVLESLWTDEGPFPSDATPTWWEVWLRRTETSLPTFRRIAAQEGLRLRDRHLEFVDREVVLAFGTADQLRSSVVLLDTLAELRRAKELASFFDGLPAREQRDWAAALLEDALAVDEDAPAVCLLDTGVNRGHSLIAPYLAEEDLHTVDPAWGTADHRGHGTEMAGLAAWGDLGPVLAGDVWEPPAHVLESVVLLPPRTAVTTPPDLYGAYTTAAVALPEITAPLRPRVFCLTVTTADGRDRGLPSSWSAEVDMLCLGRRDGSSPRLMVVSAGNVDQEVWSEYPAVNDTDPIHDPGQAWNALTVGAMTHKAWFDPDEWPEWSPLAAHGTLSPSSTTSLTWTSRWPNKPDVVFEGGNAAVSPDGDVDLPADLRLLTTSGRQPLRLFDTTGDTSGATSLAARMAVRLMIAYPEFWPETIRALMVHSAEWTAGMRAGVASFTNKTERHHLLLRRYGWGEPDFGRASTSATDVLTLVAQREIQPFKNVSKPTNKAKVETRDWDLFSLPWPRDALLALGEVEVELRVTLSYFIEPNPGRRGQASRHRYRSCGLRVAMQNPTESEADFRRRVSSAGNDEDDGHEGFGEPGWVLGSAGRTRGSVHSDFWYGAAADLALRDHLAVHPVGGWWRYTSKAERWDDKVRYALIISIRSPDTSVDIYTPVAVKVGVEIET